MAARAAQETLGIPLTRYASASTDHNVPLSLGIPSTTLGAGGVEGNNHALDEWWTQEEAWKSPQLVALTALLLAGCGRADGADASEARLIVSDQQKRHSPEDYAVFV